MSYNEFVKEEIYIFGDSNVRFYSEAIINGSHGMTGNTPEEKHASLENPEARAFFNKGYKNRIFENKSIHFFWQSAFPASRVNKIYLRDRIFDAGISSVSNRPIFIFQFGRVDLAVKVHDFQQIDKLIPSYISKCLEFAKLHNADLYFTTPIVNQRSVDIKLIKYFINSLYNFCELADLNSPIDISEMVGYDYLSEDWDELLHLSNEDSIKTLRNILSITDDNQHFV